MIAMRTLSLSLAALFLAALVSLPTGHAQPKKPKEDLAVKVEQTIKKGMEFLKRDAGGHGDWESSIHGHPNYPGGSTSLALLALLNCGTSPNDPLIQSGLTTLRTIVSNQTYVVGLQTMVYAKAGFPEDAERIQRNVDWLKKAMIYRNNEFRGWSYTDRSPDPDNSNTQYALLGLHEG